MSEDNSNGGSDQGHAVSRRQFVQSSALLTGITLGGRQLIETTPVRAQDITVDVKVADAPLVQGARARAAPPESPPITPTARPITVNEFIKLSQVLTGLDDIERDIALADEYLDRCMDYTDVNGQLKQLADVVSSLRGSSDAVIAEKLKAAGLYPAAEQIIYLWYVGGFFRLDPKGQARFWDYGPPQHYFRGKMWNVVGVHPPMTARNRVYWSSPTTEV
jgi:hypothetical protein